MQSQPLSTLAEKTNLDLGIGSSEEGRLRNKEIEQEKREYLFTAEQFHEFYNQIFVFNYITNGFSVPYHLLLPIWMSAFNLLGPAIYQKYPSFVGFNPQDSNHSSAMDPESGRCRRTDGRKWRCSKNVVPNEKYCERHMYRGRQGSRKRVESFGSVMRHHNTTSNNNRTPIMSSGTSDIDNIVPSQPCSNHRSDVQANVKSRSDENHDALFAKQSTVKACSVGNEATINVGCATNACSGSKTHCSTNEGNRAEGNSSYDDANPRKLSSRKHRVVVSPGFGLSPKSVLHPAAGNVILGSGSKNAVVAEPQRCRRTDGKKWQCRRDTLPNQKYCEVHMHRGARRVVANPESVSNSRAAFARRAHTSRKTARNLDNGINLNIMPASPHHATGNNSTCSTSDATTITDENISFCLANSLSN